MKRSRLRSVSKKVRRGGGCKACGGPITGVSESYVSRRKFCSVKCMGVGQRTRPNLSCKACGREFWTKHWTRQTCCSRKCHNDLRFRHRSKPCKSCGKPFSPNTAKRMTFCSAECVRADWRARAQAKCPQCGKEFTRLASLRRPHKRSFCDALCARMFYSRDGAPMFRGGREEGRGKGWVRLAESIRKRDGYICQRCGKTQQENGRRLSVDHIIPWRLFTDDQKAEANSPKNLASLCGPCHSWKTCVAEQKYLRGDVIQFKQYERALALDSAAEGLA